MNTHGNFQSLPECGLPSDKVYSFIDNNFQASKIHIYIYIRIHRAQHIMQKYPVRWFLLYIIILFWILSKNGLRDS